MSVRDHHRHSRGVSLISMAAALLAATAGILGASSASAQGRVFHFDIARQPLSQALRSYARICGEDVIFTEAVVAGAGTTSLVGDFTAEDALSRLLAGTPLVVQRSPSGALMIRRRAETSTGTEQRSNASVHVGLTDPPTAPAKADPPVDPSADPPEPASEPAAASAQPVEEVVVTGSRIASRSYTSDSPLVSVGAAQIAAVGQVSLDSAMGQLPQFSASQGRAEVGDVQGATGFQGGQSYSDLRGLGPQRTLVLLDGQRLVPTNPNGSIDLNLIPMALIDSVDVITGGASAVYGSDAMAGVVNFRLRQHFKGIQVSYQHNATTHGDGQENSVSVLLGGDFADNRGNAVADLEYNERGAITGADRPFFSNYLNFTRGVARGPEGIFNAGELGGSIPVSAVNAVLAQYPGTTPVSGTGNYGGYVGINNDGTLFTTRDPGNCAQNYRGPVNQLPGLHVTPDCTAVKSYLGSFFAIDVPMRRYNLFARANYKLNDNLEAYGQINFMHSTAQDLQGASYVGPGKFVYVPQNNPFVTGNSALQSLLGARSNPSNGPLEMEDWLTALGPRLESFDYNDYQATGGLKGVIGSTDLTWNLFGSYGQTLFNNGEENNTNLPALETIMYGTANYQGSGGNNCIGYAWNPLGAQPMSNGCLEYVSGTAHNTNVITQKLLEGDLSGRLARLTQGDVKFAAGVDYRGETFAYSADPRLNPAFNVMPAPIPPDIISPSYDLIGSRSGTQNVREVYGELLVPVLKDKPFAKEVAADLGIRHSQYDRFGGVNAWKTDFHWQSTRAVTIRGGFERAIRAPSLQELYNPTVQAQDAISVDPCEYNSSYRTGPNASQVAALCVAQGVPAAALPTFTYGLQSAQGIIRGNPNLSSEVAKTYSFGFLLTPRFEGPMARELGASVDYYHIKIDGAVGDVGLDAVLARCFNNNGANASYSESNFYCQQIQRDSNGFITLGREFSLNIGSYVTDGVDVEWHWGFDLAGIGLPAKAGRINLQSYISYLRSLQVSGVPGIPNVDFAGSLGDTGTVAAADGTTVSDLAHPKWKATTTLGYTVGPVSAAMRWRYIASMSDLMDGPGSGDPGVPAYSYFDLDAQWQATRNIRVIAGLTNLSDKGPPRLTGASLLTDAATYDVVGRTYYVGIRANID
jgi:outer membrane receptor protein involved in Fe transport